MKTKLIFLLLSFSLFFSCDYLEERKAKEEAIKMEERRKEQEAIAKQKAIEEQEAKRQDMKNNIAKYVYISRLSLSSSIVNDTDYTIDEVAYEYGEMITDDNGYLIRDGSNNYKVKTIQKKVYYIPAHSEKNVPKISIITSIKCKALEIN